MAEVDLAPLPRLVIEPTVRNALAEDFGAVGDLTTDAIIPVDAQAKMRIVARIGGRVCGVEAARLAFSLVDSALEFSVKVVDGADVAAAETIATIEGSARAILSAERTALNFMGHLSGIATVTRDLVNLLEGLPTRLCCTRKTTPGLRALEKYAVRAGGGANHRFGLGDGILIKDNHIAVAGSITAAVASAKARSGHMVKIEVEVDDLIQLDEALKVGVDAVLLDNMDVATLSTAVKRIGGRAVAEASGGITPENFRGVAETGVDLISMGWITHSAPSLDLGLDADISNKD